MTKWTPNFHNYEADKGMFLGPKRIKDQVELTRMELGLQKRMDEVIPLGEH